MSSKASTAAFSKIQLKVHNLNLCLKSYNRSVSILSTEPVVWYISPTRGSLSGGTKVYVYGRGKWKIFYSSFLDLLQCDLASSKGSVVTMICKKRQVQQWKITSWTTSFLMGQLVFLHGQTVQGIREFIAYISWVSFKLSYSFLKSTNSRLKKARLPTINFTEICFLFPLRFCKWSV